MLLNTIIAAVLAASLGVQAGEVLLLRQYEHRLQAYGQANGTTRVVSMAEQGMPSWETESWAEKVPLTELGFSSSVEDQAFTMVVPKSKTAQGVEPTEGYTVPEETKTPAVQAPQPDAQAEERETRDEAPIVWRVSDFLAVGMSVVVTATVFAAAA